MQRLLTFVQSFKKLCFQILFILHHNSFKNKHLLVLVEQLQLFSLVYFYLNPFYYQLHNFQIYKLFIDKIWPQIFTVVESKQFIVSLALLLIFPAIIISIVIMKMTMGYQYLVVLAIQIWLLFYPVFFIKFTIQTVNIVVGFPGYQVIGVFVSILHTAGSVMALHLYEKKFKYLDLIPVILIYLKVNSYAVVAVVAVRIVISHLISPKTLIKHLRIYVQVSLFIILIFAYFASDFATNYISFSLFFFIYNVAIMLSIIKNYNEYDSIFHHLDNLSQEQCQSKLKYYEFVQNHRIECQNLQCMCRQLHQYVNDQQIKQKGLQFVLKLYSFKQDFRSRIQLGQVCCQQYQFRLSGLLLIFQLKPQSIYEQYLVYYIKTKYQQQFRKQDKNYQFGKQYYNAYEQLRSFEQKIQQLTKTIKLFWLTIYQFDGSSRFLSMIMDISDKITGIKIKYDVYKEKYEEFSGQFRYLYKTFQIAVLNLVDKQKMENGYSSAVLKQQIDIKVPERQILFISDSQARIVNSNRQFCNLVQIDKAQLIRKSYCQFIPQTCSEQHAEWVTDWYSKYDHDQQPNATCKPMKLKNQYIKSVKLSNRILPRFNTGIQIITFIRVMSNLESLYSNKALNVQTGLQYRKQSQDSQFDEFFSFLIQKKSMKIVGMDDSFFYTTMIDESDQLRKKILNLRLNEVFPKVFITPKQKQGLTANVQGCRQAMLNYSILQQFLETKQKSSFIGNSKNYSEKFPVLSNFFFKQSQNQDFINEEPLAFARKIRKKLSNISNLSSGYKLATHIKENSQQVFLYEVLEQKNIGLDTQYCIVSFKLKKNMNSEVQNMFSKAKQKLKSKNIINIQNQNQNQVDQVVVDQSGQSLKHQLVRKLNQQANFALGANLSYREPFIRSSKPFKEDGDQQQVQAKKAQIQQSDQFNNLSKNFCLPWPILIPLFAVHVIYLHIQSLYEGTLVYLKQTFNFYDKYEYEILRQLNVKFGDLSYIQDLKSLWIQGYGFYHSSILVFQHPQDEYFVSKLYDHVIKEYHYGIYEQITSSLDAQILQMDKFYYLIISVLLFFILYILLDFIFNLWYCFDISNKVTQIILIFLNIEQGDIRKMVYSIQKYQNQVLEMVDFGEIQGQRKKQKQNYKIQGGQSADLVQLSGVGLLKSDNYAFFAESRIKNVDSLDNSLVRKEPNYPMNDEQFFQTPVIIPKNWGGDASHSRIRGNNQQKMNIQRLKDSTSMLQSVSSDQIHLSMSSILGNSTGMKNSLKKQANSRDHHSNISLQAGSKFPQRIDQQLQQDSLFPEQQLKKQRIEKFKLMFRGKLNDIKESPKSYIFLLVALLLTACVLVCATVLLPSYVSNMEKFSKVYFDFRKLKIVLLKQLIKKSTGMQLKPQVRASVYSQEFYFVVRNQLKQLPRFQAFWQKAYTSNVCAMIDNAQVKSVCLNLGSQMTSFGLKVMTQYIQDSLRRITAQDLFTDTLAKPSIFMQVVRLQIYLITLGQRSMQSQISQYTNNVQSYQLMVISIGTGLLCLCIFLSRQALNDIRDKINDGENLLLIVPEGVKLKYHDKIKKNRVDQLTISIKMKQEKRKNKRRIAGTLGKDKNLLNEPQLTGTQLIPDNSAILNKDEKTPLKQSFGNQTQSRLRKKTFFGSNSNAADNTQKTDSIRRASLFKQ